MLLSIAIVTETTIKERCYMNKRQSVEWFVWTGEEDPGYIFQALQPRFPDLTVEFVEEVVEYMINGGGPM